MQQNRKNAKGDDIPSYPKTFHMIVIICQLKNSSQISPVYHTDTISPRCEHSYV